MCMNSVKETCFFSEVPKVDLSDFGNKLFFIDAYTSFYNSKALRCLSIACTVKLYFNSCVFFFIKNKIILSSDSHT